MSAKHDKRGRLLASPSPRRPYRRSRTFLTVEDAGDAQQQREAASNDRAVDDEGEEHLAALPFRVRPHDADDGESERPEKAVVRGGKFVPSPPSADVAGEKGSTVVARHRADEDVPRAHPYVPYLEKSSEDARRLRCSNSAISWAEGS